MRGRKKVLDVLNGQCVIDSCPNKYIAGGLCSKHYTRKRITGDPLKTLNSRGNGYITPSGYKIYTINYEHIPEHHLVMEQHLGRDLTSEESVHHKNGDRLDNRLENLELWSRYQPSGQRVVDKVVWAKEILSLYEPSSLSQNPKKEVEELD